MYPTSYAGLVTTLPYGAGDSITVSNMTSTSAGFHIYRENSAPNNTTNVPASATANYYGVFFTDTAATYDVVIDYSGWANPTSCTGLACNALYARDNNASAQWSPNGDSLASCVAYSAGQSSVGTSRRSEFFILPEIAFNSELGNDSLLCSGDTVIH